MFKESNHKAIKYMNKGTVMCMMSEVDENVTFKNRKIVSTLRGTNNVRVTDLSYEYKFPNCLYSCEFKKKVEGQIY